MRGWHIYLLGLSTLIATEPRISNLSVSTFSYGQWQAVDLDGDGDLDYVGRPVARSNGTAQLTWFENLGNNSFSFQKHVGYVRGFANYSITDSDRNGVLDFVTFHWETPIDSWIPKPEIHFIDPLGSGNETHLQTYFDESMASPYLIELNDEQHPFVIDFHKDGRVTFQISEITPERTLTRLTERTYFLPEDFDQSVGSFTIEAEDLDLDGDLDLFIAHEVANRSFIFERISPTEFSEHPTHEIPNFYEHCADLDQDGDIDLYHHSGWGENRGDFSSLFARNNMPEFDHLIRTPNGLRLIDREHSIFVEYQLQGDGSWLETLREEPSPLPAFGLGLENASRSYEIADFDGDGFDELFLLRDNTSTYSGPRTKHLTVLRRTGQGYEPIAASAPPVPIDYSNPVVADFDNDLDMDVLVGPTPSGDFFLQLNDGNGNFTLTQSPLNFYPEDLDPREFLITSLKAVHFDEDQHLDLAITFEKEINSLQVESACTIIKGTGPLTFEPTILPEGSFSFVQKGFCEITEFVDWDGDGDLDAILEGGWRENIDGELSPLFRPLLSNATTTDALGNPVRIRGHQVADIDNDGAPDYVTSAYSLGTRYFRYGGIGLGGKIYFTIAEAQQAGIPLTSLIPEQFSQIAIAFNQGNGSIGEIILVDISLTTHDALGNPKTHSVGILDLDANGTLELYSPIIDSDALGNPVVVGYEKWTTPAEEPRNFAEATRIPISLPFLPDSGELKDFDGDGTLEYVSAEQFIQPNSLGPLISPRHDFAGDLSLTHNAFPPTAVGLADFDGDGDLDHLIPGRESRLSLVRNLIINESSPITKALLSKGFIGTAVNPDSDCDGDGFSNAFEYLFGTDPTENRQEEPADLAPSWITHDGYPELRFLRRRDAAQYRLDYVLERSRDLINWEEVPLHDAESSAIDNTWEWVTTKDVIGEGSFFFRTNPQHRP